MKQNQLEKYQQIRSHLRDYKAYPRENQAVSKSGTGTRGQGTCGHGDSGTWGRGDAGMWGLCNTFLKYMYRISEMGEHIPKKVELLMVFCKNDRLYAFQVPPKYTAKFKNWILKKSLFSPPVTELDCETKQKT